MSAVEDWWEQEHTLPTGERLSLGSGIGVSGDWVVFLRLTGLDNGGAVFPDLEPIQARVIGLALIRGAEVADSHAAAERAIAAELNQ